MFVFVLAFVFIFAIIATTEFIEYFIEEENEEVVFVVSTIDKIQDALYDDIAMRISFCTANFWASSSLDHHIFV